jgi:hypothetical protein
MEIAFDRPAVLSAITFDCFCDGTVRLQVNSASTTGTATTITTSIIEVVHCGEGSHEMDPASRHRQFWLIWADPVDAPLRAVRPAARYSGTSGTSRTGVPAFE